MTDGKTAPGLQFSVRWQYLLLAGILLLTLVLRLSFIHEPFERDEGAYAYLGQEILRGKIPYKEAREIKPPGIMYIYAAMIGVFNVQTSEGIRIATAVYVLFTVVSVFWFVRYLYGARAGLIAAFLFSIFSSGPLIQGSSCNSETFLVLPLMLSACFFVRWMDEGKRSLLVWTGLFCGLSLLIKTVALPQVVLICVFLAYCLVIREKTRPWMERVKDVAVFAAPPLLLLTVLIAYLAVNGALADAIFYNYTFLKRYGGDSWEVRWQLFSNTFSVVTREHLLLWVLGLPTLFWLLLVDKSRKAVFTALLVPVAFIGLSLPGKFYPHYFIQLMPPLAVVAGIGMNALWERRKARLWCLPVVLVVAAYCFTVEYKFYFTLTPEQVCVEKYGKQGMDFVQAVYVSRYIKERTSKNDYIFSWTWEPQIYFLSGRKPTNRHGADVSIPWAQDPDAAIVEVDQTIREKKPKYIVVHARSTDTLGYEVVEDILDEFYYMEAVFLNYGVFRLRGA